MATEPLLSGDIPSDGVLDVLREIESRRITGKIRFVVGNEAGEVELVGGQIAMDQDPLPDGSDPVEALLRARSGLYAVHAVLPPLPVSQGDERQRAGSLAVHVPADLMTYCEQAGLTGVLEMVNAGRVVEVIYEAGEMLGIRLDGREDADLGEVFAWDQGSFRIEMRTEAEVRSRLPTPDDAPPGPPVEPEDPADREPTVRFARPEPDGGPTRRYAKVEVGAGREDTGKQFLRVVEMALTEVVSVREKARASMRSAPPPKARPSVRPPASRATKPKDSTVRIVWIGGEPSVEQDVPAPLSARADPTSSEPIVAKAATSDGGGAYVGEVVRAKGRHEPTEVPVEQPMEAAAHEPPASRPLPAPAALPREVPSSDEPKSPATIAMLVALLVAVAVITYFTYLATR
ncbi:MAG: hypothetical protein OHK0013_16850 [Sandaracinaceae bacterium]